MSETNLLRGKREQFHIELRRNHLEKIFNNKRKVQNVDTQISQYYETQIEKMGKIQLLELLKQINEKVTKPIIEMVQNELGFQLCRLLQLNEIYNDWELFKNVLTYLQTMVLLPDEYLQKYFRFQQMLQSFIEFYIVLEQEIFRKGICIIGNDPNDPLIYKQDEQSRLSFTFIKIDQILLYSVTTFQARKDILKNKLAVQTICHTFHNKMDNGVLEQHLQFVSTLLQDLYKQENDCRKHAEVFIKPVCFALQTKNKEKQNYLLQILLNLSFVGMQNGYINQIFKFNGAIELMQILNDGTNDHITLRILAEIAQQSPAHIEILIKNGLLQLITHKLNSNNKSIQYQALWVVEFCISGGKQFYDVVFQNFEIAQYSINLMNSEDEQVRIQACFVVCAYLMKGGPTQIQQLCQSKNYLQMFSFLNHQNPELKQSILESILNLLNIEVWLGQANSLLSQANKDQIRLILEQQQEGDQSLFSMINQVLSCL